MAINLSFYGGPSNAQTNPPVNLMPLTPYVNLFRAAPSDFSVPEGVLLRRISSIEDAIAVGGLVLFSPTSKKTWFACGRDLNDAMVWKQVGCFAEMVRENIPDLPASKLPQATVRLHSVGRGYLHNWSGGKAMSNWGGVISPIRKRTALFADTDVVYAFGIVTGAQYGLGTSTQAATAASFGYMASLARMNMKFADWVKTVKDVTILAADSSIRDYYARSFDSALALFPEAQTVPTSSVCTYWAENKLQTEIASPFGSRYNASSFKMIAQTQAASELLSGQGFEELQAHYDVLKTSTGRDWEFIQSSNGAKALSLRAAGMLIASTTTDGVASAIFTLENEAGAWCSDSFGSWRGVTTRRFDAPVMTGASVFCQNNPAGVGTSYTPVAPGKIKSPVGVISGLTAGRLRDGHVMTRSLDDGRLFHKDAANFTSAGEYLKNLIASAPTIGLDTSNIVTMTDAANFERNSLLQGSHRGRSWADRGTLIPMYTRFQDAWDAAAKKLAEKEN